MTKGTNAGKSTRAGILAAGLLVAGGAAFFFFRGSVNDGVERLWFDTQKADVSAVAIREGALYFVRYSRPTTSPAAQPSSETFLLVRRETGSGAERTLLRRTVSVQSIVSSLQVGADAVSWLESEWGTPPVPGNGAIRNGALDFGFRSPVTPQFPVAFANAEARPKSRKADYGSLPPSDPAKRPPGVKMQVGKYVTPPPEKDYRLFLRRLPLSGGPMTETKLDAALQNATQIFLSPDGEMLYWVTKNVRNVTRFETAGAEWQESPADGVLMRRAADGGAAEKLAEGLAGNSPTEGQRIAVTENLICWIKRAPYPDGTATAYCLPPNAPPGTAPYVLPDYRSAQMPVAYQGKLYWIEAVASGDEESVRIPQGFLSGPTIGPITYGTRLVCMPCAGGEKRIVLGLQDKQYRHRDITSLFVQDNQLYVGYNTVEVAPRKPSSGDAGSSPPFVVIPHIAHLLPDRPDPLGGTIDVLNCGQTDKDYCYYIEAQKEATWRNIADIFYSSSIVRPNETYSLYRRRLPK